MTDYPAALPAPVVEGTTMVGQVGLSRVNMDEGAPRQRRKHYNMLQAIQLQFVVEQADLAAFTQFMNTSGYDWFNLPVPNLGSTDPCDTTQVRLTSDISAAPMSEARGYYRVTCTAEMAPIGSSAAPGGGGGGGGQPGGGGGGPTDPDKPWLDDPVYFTFDAQYIYDPASKNPVEDPIRAVDIIADSAPRADGKIYLFAACAQRGGTIEAQGSVDRICCKTKDVGPEDVAIYTAPKTGTDYQEFYAFHKGDPNQSPIWSLPPIPYQSSTHSLCYLDHNDNIYVFATLAAAPTWFYRFDTVTNVWIECASPNVDLPALACSQPQLNTADLASLGNEIIMLSGVTNEVAIYDADQDKWTALYTFPQWNTRDRMRAAGVHSGAGAGKVYFAGGRNIANAEPDDLWEFDPSDGSIVFHGGVTSNIGYDTSLVADQNGKLLHFFGGPRVGLSHQQMTEIDLTTFVGTPRAHANIGFPPQLREAGACCDGTYAFAKGGTIANCPVASPATGKTYGNTMFYGHFDIANTMTFTKLHDWWEDWQIPGGPLRILEVTDHAAIKHVATLNWQEATSPVIASALAYDEPNKMLYVKAEVYVLRGGTSARNVSIQKIDVTDPATPTLVGAPKAIVSPVIPLTYSGAKATALLKDNANLIVCGPTSQQGRYDQFNLEVPAINQVGNTYHDLGKKNRYAVKVAAGNNLLWLAHDDKLTSIDIDTTTETPTTLNSITKADFVTYNQDKDWAVVISVSEGKIEIWDVSTPASPAFLGEIQDDELKDTVDMISKQDWLFLVGPSWGRACDARSPDKMQLLFKHRDHTGITRLAFGVGNSLYSSFGNDYSGKVYCGEYTVNPGAPLPT